MSEDEFHRDVIDQPMPSKHFDEALSEARWQRLFDDSPATLDRLEAEVDDSIAKGEFSEMDPDEL